MKIPYTWGNADFTWNDNDFIWQDVYYILEKIKKGGNNSSSISSLTKKEKEKLIKVILTLNGIDYREQKTIFKTYKVTAKDIEMVSTKIKILVESKSIKIV
jgi:predicted CopG family antitoxin